MTGLADREAHFRPDLEGLRAVAVLLVLLYHAGITGFAGGYVGVDVFFVLSGFFITGVIDRELTRTGGLDIAAFYARRVRRLLPAAAVVLLATLVATILILPSFRWREATADISGAGLYVSNLRFGMQANDYFQATASPSPVLHFWSLSLEEQFYLFWPAILLVASRLPLGDWKHRRIGIAVLLIGIFSLAGGIWLTGVNQPWAFFLLPTRAWELAVGGLLAIRSPGLGAVPRRAATLATTLGVGLILASNLLVNDSTPFPGTAALLPVAGSALVIVGGLPAGTNLVRRLLSSAPMTYLGRISYSLYLWHWPILVFGTVLMGVGAAPLLAVAAIGIAALSQRLVEQPMRYGRFIGTKPRWNLVQAASIAMVVVVACSAVTSVRTIQSPAIAYGAQASAAHTGAPTIADGPPKPCSGCSIDNLVPPLDSLNDGLLPACSSDDVANPEKCAIGSPSSQRVIAVFGDSFAWQWLTAFDEIGRTSHLRVLGLVRSACPPAAVTVWSDELKRTDTDCDAWRELALRRIEAEHPSLVVLASSDYESLVGVDGSVIPRDGSLDGPHSTRWIAGLAVTLKRLAATGTRIAIIEQPPLFQRVGMDPVACIAANPTTFGAACRGSRTEMTDGHTRAVDHQAASATQVTFLDPADWLCDAQICPAVIGNFVVYRDRLGHLTGPIALSLRARLADALALAGT